MNLKSFLFLFFILGFSLNACAVQETPDSPITLVQPESSAVNPEPLEQETLRIRLVAVGDNLIHEPIYTMAARNAGYMGFNFQPSYAAVSERIAEADIAFLEQEVLVSGEDYLISAWPSFNSPKELAGDMQALGFDIINLANNHILDKDTGCLEETMNVWNSLDMPTIGVYDSRIEDNALHILEVKGCRLAFLGYCYGLNSWEFSDAWPFVVGNLYDRTRMEADIAAAKEQADLVIVSMHWGTEYSLEPDSEQRDLAVWLAERNVDLVLGHHPHVIQPTELLTRADGLSMPVIYSLGNFISCQRRSESLLGTMAHVDILHGEQGWQVQVPRHTALVSHYEDPYGETPYVVVLPLASYDDTLAARHDYAPEDPRLTPAWLDELYHSVIAEAYRG